jgi:two-component system sensor histidine kinase KdpD
MEDLTRQHERVDLLRRRLVNVVGHELKLPVSTISGLANALAHASDDEIRDVIAPALVRSAARLERLVDDLLLASGVMTVLPVAAPRPTPVGPALTAAWTTAGVPGAPSPTPASAVALVREDALDRILAAVLDNAAKYGESPVETSVTSSGATVVISVSTGGVPGPADLENALEPFYRGEQAVTSAPGLGLGLAVAAALAEQDGGSVTIGAEDQRVVTSIVLPAPR